MPNEEPWVIYYDELRRRAERADGQRFGRDEAIANAAHEAYRSTADRLTTQDGWEDDRVLVVTRAFGQTVKEWLAADGRDWDALRDRLRSQWGDWQQAGG